MICLQNICKSYGDQEILKNINLNISAGEFVLLLGKSGSGKSTLLNIIGLIDKPSQGKYIFNDTCLNSLSPAQSSDFRARNFGFIFQRYNLIPSLSALQNILLASEYARNKNAESKALSMLARLDMSACAHKLAAHLSGGQQQRVSIIRALINGAEFILADEPSGALDSANARALMQLLKSANERGVGIIMVTHDESLQSYASRIVRLKDGRIISDERAPADAASTGNLETERNLETGAAAGVSTQNLETATADTASVGNLETTPASTQNLETTPASTTMPDLAVFARLFISALKSLKAHKLRSLLTMLGIIIASAAIICTIALGNGAKASVLAEISFLGNNTIIVQKGSFLGDTQASRQKDLQRSDIDLLRSLAYVEDVGVMGSLAAAQASANSKLVGISAFGVLENFPQIKNKKLAFGRFFARYENERAASVVVLSHSLAKSLFSQPQNALLQVVFINNQPLKIIGVLASDRQDNEAYDLNAYIPANTLAAGFSGDFVISRLYVLLKPSAPSEQAERAIKQALKLRRGEDSITTFNLDAIKQTIEGTANKLSALIFGVAAIAMVVGGIGVMNIMLVAIRERTKEIGIKLAIGARPGLIAAEFLLEALALVLIGSAIGAGLASAVVIVLDTAGVKMILSPLAYALGIGLSAVCGLVFGYFPARRAGRLLPSECLSDL